MGQREDLPDRNKHSAPEAESSKHLLEMSNNPIWLEDRIWPRKDKEGWVKGWGWVAEVQKDPKTQGEEVWIVVCGGWEVFGAFLVVGGTVVYSAGLG